MLHYTVGQPVSGDTDDVFSNFKKVTVFVTCHWIIGMILMVCSPQELR